MTCFEITMPILTFLLAFAVGIAVWRQTILAGKMKNLAKEQRDFTKEQIKMNNVNIRTAHMNAESNFYSQMFSQNLQAHLFSYEKLRMSQEQRSQILIDASAVVDKITNWSTDFQNRLDKLKKHFPPLD